MTNLTGTEKQITWAEDIAVKAEVKVKEVVNKLSNKEIDWIAIDLQPLVAKKLEEFYQETVATKSASLWIDRKFLSTDLERSSALEQLSELVIKDLGGEEKYQEFARQERTKERELRRKLRNQEVKK